MFYVLEYGYGGAAAAAAAAAPGAQAGYVYCGKGLCRLNDLKSNNYIGYSVDYR